MANKPKTEKLSAQSRKFIEAAKELGCAEDEAGFDEIVKKVAKAPPPRKDEKPKADKATRPKRR
jgi:hypothetical protein